MLNYFDLFVYNWFLILLEFFCHCLRMQLHKQTNFKTSSSEVTAEVEGTFPDVVEIQDLFSS